MLRRFSSDDVAALVEMAERGFDGKTIGLALDRDPEAVRKKCVALGIQLRPASLNSRRFKLKSRTWIVLEAWARRLRMKPSKLARQIVEVVIKEDLLSAVLDLPPSLRLETSSIERKWAARLAGRNFGDAPEIGSISSASQSSVTANRVSLVPIGCRRG